MSKPTLTCLGNEAEFSKPRTSGRRLGYAVIREVLGYGKTWKLAEDADTPNWGAVLTLQERMAVLGYHMRLQSPTYLGGPWFCRFKAKTIIDRPAGLDIEVGADTPALAVSLAALETVRRGSASAGA